MPTTTPFRTNSNLGPDLFQVVKAGGVWYDGPRQVMSPQFGDVAHSNDGRKAVFVQATAAIPVAAAPGTQVTVTSPGMTAAPGTGGYYAPSTAVYNGTIAAGDGFWALLGATA
jgi:hypothetical protein